MPKTYLTAISIEALKAERQTDFWDTKLASFGIRVGPRTKTFVTKIGNRRITLGQWPQTSLQDARKKALALKGGSLNPVAPPFSEALDAFLAVKATQLRPRSHKELERSLRRHFKWTKTLDKITHADVLCAIEAIKAPSEAMHAFKDIRSFFNWCVPRYIPHSPCNGLKSPSLYTPRNVLLTDEQARAIWRAAEDMGPYGALVQALFATGQRVGQFLNFDPAWIKDDTIVFPASVMKGGREHVIPLGEFTRPILERLRPMTYQGKPKRELDRRSGVAGWVLHDARRFFSSSHARPEVRTPIDVTEALLAHRTGSRTEIQRVYDLYDRMPEMRNAIQKYEQFLLGLLQGRN